MELLEEPLALITSVRVSKLLEEKATELAPKSRKHLRGCAATSIRSSSSHAGRAAPGATALYAGLREGEIFGLRKADVDLAQGILMVWRSWDQLRTKGAKTAPVPIAAALRPHLEEALRSRGELVFPRADGSMHPRELRLGKMLRRAVAAAGLVIGYEWRCRAWRCGWREKRPSKAVLAECPKCHRPTTRAKPLPRHVRFHDTRHSFGTQVTRAAGLAVAQQALRHSDSRLTAETYGHLELGDLRKGMLVAFPGKDADAQSETGGDRSPVLRQNPVRAETIDDSAKDQDSPRPDASRPRSPPADAPLGLSLPT